MACSGNLKYIQTPKLWLLALVWIVIWDFSATESAAHKSVSGEIGGNVTFPCPVDKTRTVNFFYLQRDDTFVNGYYASKDVKKHTTPWENTIVDRSETALHMYRLNLSHSGVYQCYIQYSGSPDIATTSIRLSVTARYSKPTVTISCKENDLSCLVTCTSHDGYPQTKMMFNVNVSGNSSSQVFNVVNNSEVRNPATMMYDSTSTANFNCSYGELQFLSCSVGEVTSDMFSVCKPEEKPKPFNHYVIVAALAVVLLVTVTIIMVGLQLFRQSKKRQTGMAESRIKECAEEVIFIDEIAANQGS